ncbi:MAG: hypothetical protein LWX07_04480 [Bacteroidetes bacterium]|nr:hypothetical protein [Bacteroidota bacterium]
MKNPSIISGILLAILFIVAFTFGQSQDTPQNKPASDPFHVIVKGCDNCKDLYYCMNGRNPKKPGSCDFYAECDPTGAVVQTICVKCGDKAGTATIKCGSTREVTIEVSQIGADCKCNTVK